MALAPRQRWMVLGSALALTLGLAVWLGEEPAEPPPAPPSEAPEEAGPAQSGRVVRIEPEPPGSASPASQGGEIADIFAPQSWQAPAPAEAAAPSGPAEPELPFTYFGRLVEGGRVTVYLATPDRNLAVGKGDVIDRTWRVESIGPTAVVFRHLPEGRRQILEIGKAK